MTISEMQIQQLRRLVEQVKSAVVDLDAYLVTVTLPTTLRREPHTTIPKASSTLEVAKLDNATGEMIGYTFTCREDGCYFVPSIRIDGPIGGVRPRFFIGPNERYDVREDGRELVMSDGSAIKFAFNTPFGRFIDSLIEKGFPRDELPDLSLGGPLNLSALVGRRFRLKCERDKQASDHVVNLVIGAVLGSSSNAQPNDEAVEVRACEVLRSVLESGPCSRKDLSLRVSKALSKEKQKNEPFADAVMARVLDEDWRDGQDWIDVSKKGELSIAS